MTALFERLSARLGAAVPLAVPGLQLVPKGAIALAEHVNRYYRVFTGADPQNVAVRLPTGGGSFEVRHSATNAALLRVTDAGLDFPAGGIGTVELQDGSVTSAKILDNEIVNADVNAAAAIALTKLAHVGANNVLRSNGTANVGGQVSTADIADGQVTSLKILDGTILNVDVNAAAAIAYGKLALASSIVNADIAAAGAANIAVAKLAHLGAGNILRSDGVQNVASPMVTGDIPAGTIMNANINAAANINGAKLLDNSVSSAKLSGGLSVPANTITTTEIADGTILNVDINAAAAIALTKLAHVGANNVLRSNGTANVGGQVSTADIADGAVGQSAIGALLTGGSAIYNGAASTPMSMTTPCTLATTGGPVMIVGWVSFTAASASAAAIAANVDGVGVSMEMNASAASSGVYVNMMIAMRVVPSGTVAAPVSHTFGLSVRTTGGVVWQVQSGQVVAFEMKK